MTARKPTVRVVIVNWNGGTLLAEAVTALLASTPACMMDVVVVDNGSLDDSIAWACDAAAVGVVRLIELGRNTGFAYACNRGAADFAGDYLLFLNPDTRVEPDAVEKALTVFAAHGGGAIGIVGIQSRGEGGDIQRTCARFPSVWNLLNEALGLASAMPHLFPGLHRGDFNHFDSSVVDHVIGAFYLVDAKLFASLGGFDERYFVYLEDLDFSLRAKQSGYSCYFLAQARMYHKGGGISSQVKYRRLFYSLRSRLLYAFRHFGTSAAWPILAVTLTIEPILRILRAAAQRSPSDVANTAKAFAMLYRALPEILRKA